MGKQLTAVTRALMAERFGRDTLLSLATCTDQVPYVRTVNGYYEDGAFYVITYEPVSYTHLDVYKRQGRTPSGRRRGYRGGARASACLRFHRKDVYKRQMLQRGRHLGMSGKMPPAQSLKPVNGVEKLMEKRLATAGRMLPARSRKHVPSAVKRKAGSFTTMLK